MCAIYFFSGFQNKKHREYLKLPTNPECLQPLTLGNFLNWYKEEHDQEIYSKTQRVVELKSGTNKIIFPYGPLADSQVKFTVVSEDGEYTGSAAINVAKENTLLRFFFRMLS